MEKMSFLSLVDQSYLKSYSYLKQKVRESFRESLVEDAAKLFMELLDKYVEDEKKVKPGIYKTEFKNFKHIPLGVGAADVKLELALAIDTTLLEKNIGNNYRPVKVEFAGRFYIKNLSNIFADLPWFEEALEEVLKFNRSEVKDIISDFSRAVYGDLTENFENGEQKAVVAKFFGAALRLRKDGGVAYINADYTGPSYWKDLWGTRVFGDDDPNKLDIVKAIIGKARELQSRDDPLHGAESKEDLLLGTFLFLLGELVKVVANEIILLLYYSGKKSLSDKWSY
jgi:hypothetical protein